MRKYIEVPIVVCPSHAGHAVASAKNLPGALDSRRLFTMGPVSGMRPHVVTIRSTLLRSVLLIVLGILSACHNRPPNEALVNPPELISPAGFDLARAMIELFGNYNEQGRFAIYDVPSTTPIELLDGSSFERGDEIKVRPFWVAETEIEGAPKVVLLAYSIPRSAEFASDGAGDESFSCHACAPLIASAIFRRQGDKWQLEASRTAVTRLGGWGVPPRNVSLIAIGRQHLGVLVTAYDGGQGFHESTVSLLVPWEGKVNEALNFESSSDNSGACGKDLLPCYQNRARLRFAPGPSADYDDAFIKLSGTKLNDDRSSHPKRVRGERHYRFSNGRYEQLTETGELATVGKK